VELLSVVGNHAARHTLRILPLSLDSFRGRALPSGFGFGFERVFGRSRKAFPK